MSFSAHSAFLCDRLLNMFCSAAYKLAPPFGHIKVELCPGLEPNSWTKSAKPQCLCGIILFVLLYRNHRSGARFRLPSYSENSFALFCVSATLFSAKSGSLCSPCRSRAFQFFLQKMSAAAQNVPGAERICTGDVFGSLGPPQTISRSSRSRSMYFFSGVRLASQ